MAYTDPWMNMRKRESVKHSVTDETEDSLLWTSILTFYIVNIITTLWIAKKKVPKRRDYMYGCIKILINKYFQYFSY